jgi:hypothetical protein
MKLKLFFGILFCISFITLTAQTTYVPDDEFEQALIDLGYDTVLDDFVLTANINTVTSLTVVGYSIADLTGIEGFTSLKELDCSFILLTSLDVTQNTALTNLDCEFNNLTSLDVTQNTVLTNLTCDSNQLTSLDVTQNTVLTDLSCADNQLTNLDVTQNTVLTDLDCNRNLIKSLDLTQNTALIILDCWTNQLTSLNVKNGNNTNFTFFDSNVNPNLTCIEVDNVAWSTANWTNIDPASSFSEDCGSLSLEDVSLQNISIYPNPTQNEFKIQGLEDNSQLEIYSLNGQLVLKQQNYKSSTIDVSDLSASVYFVKISNGNGTSVKRLVRE